MTSTIAVVGSGRDLYREYLMDGVSAGHDVCLVDDRPLGWRGRYVRSYLNCPLTLEGVLDAMRGPNGPRLVDGVLTWEEQSVVLAAQLAEKLDVHTRPPVDAVRRARDKHQMRQAWAAAAIPSAQSVLVQSAAEAVAAFDRFAPAAVVKPRSLAASAGVRLVRDRAEAAAAFESAALARLDRYPAESAVLVEEYLDGPEFSVEAALAGDEFVPLAVTAKTTGPLPHFEEIQHVVGAPLAEHAPLLDVVRRAVACLGLRHTMLHAEVRITAAGPAMVEVGARLGGDLIPHVAELAIGRSLGKVAAAIATGRFEGAVPPVEERYAGIRFLYPPHGGTLRNLTLPEVLTNCPWVHRVVRAVGPGVVVPGPERGGTASRLGYVIVTGWSAQSVQARLDEVASATEITVDREA